MSHGESFLELLRTRFDSPGFYCLDEPEAALSFSSTLGLIGALHDAGRGRRAGALRHPLPVLAAMPGATLLEVGDWGYGVPPGTSWSSCSTGRPTWRRPGATCATCSTEPLGPAEQRHEHRVGAVPVRPELDGAGHRPLGARHAGELRRRGPRARRRRGRRTEVTTLEVSESTGEQVA